MLYPSSLLRILQKFMLLKTSLRMQLLSLSSINYMFIKRSRQEFRKKYKNKIIKFYERGSFWWANVLQRYSPWNVDIGQVFLKDFWKRSCRNAVGNIRCQDVFFWLWNEYSLGFDEDESIYYAKNYGSDIVLATIKTTKNQENIIDCTINLKYRYFPHIMYFVS